jgi:hypothetical protein
MKSNFTTSAHLPNLEWNQRNLLVIYKSWI